MSVQSKNAHEPFTITRTFSASRELVFQAWTDPEKSKLWLSPAGFTISYSKADIRPGGVAHYCMSGPNGMKMWGKANYRKIEKPKLLEYVQCFSDEQGGVTRHPMSPTWPAEMLTTISFEEQGAKTVLTLQWMPLNATAEEMQTFEGGRQGMSGGWGGSFDQLDAFLAKGK